MGGVSFRYFLWHSPVMFFPPMVFILTASPEWRCVLGLPAFRQSYIALYFCLAPTILLRIFPSPFLRFHKFVGYIFILHMGAEEVKGNKDVFL